MTARTATFLELQRLYRERAEKDVAALREHVQQAESINAETRQRIPVSYVRTFAKNARHLRCWPWLFIYLADP